MVRYHIDVNDRVVTAWASERLRFEPKGWQLEYREQLRAALRALPPGEGVLIAELATASEDFFDVENVLLYNVGSGCLSHLVRGGLAFRSLRGAVSPTSDLQAGPSATRATYRVVPAPDVG